MTDLPKRVRKELEEAIIKRARAKDLETEAKELSDQAKETILPILTAYDLKGYAIPNVGKVSSRVRAGSSINEQKLKEALLTRGVPVDVVVESVEAARKMWETEYVEFKAEK